jgi:hypothetical protein
VRARLVTALPAVLALVSAFAADAGAQTDDLIFRDGFESGLVAFGPPFTAVLRGTTGVPVAPEPLRVRLGSPATVDTFVSITSSDPLRLTVVGGGVTVPTGQTGADVTVNALVASAQPVTLLATLDGTTLAADVRVEGSLTDTNVPDEADYCNVQFPPSFMVVAGQPTPLVYGSLFEGGVTEAPGAPLGWISQVGYGPLGTNPILLDGWRFYDATYNTQYFVTDEFQASFVAPLALGTFSTTYRFSNDGGALWTYCDVNGSGSNSGFNFEVFNLGTMTVQSGSLNETDQPAEADYCNLQYPPAFTVAAGQPTPPVYGQLYEAGVTNPVGPPSGWIAQVGYGPLGSSPIEGFGWQFFDATYNVQFGNNDEFQASFTAPAFPDTFSTVFRFSNDGGVLWTYCDLDGAGSNPGLTFETTSLGTMTVQ